MKKMIIVLFCFAIQEAIAQDTIRVGHTFERFNQLEMGTRKDVIYNLLNGEVRGLALKTRTTRLVTINGKEYLSIIHDWVAPDSKWKGRFEYLCEPGTLKPVQHIRKTETSGVEAFQFLDGEITGLDSASNNTQSDFVLKLAEATYNWEIDLETYSLLPMKEGYHAVMNFYHPGGKTPPRYYHLKVTGSEKLVMPDGSQMDCWILFTDYRGTQPTRFWYTKQSQNFIKMEGEYRKMTIRKERIY